MINKNMFKWLNSTPKKEDLTDKECYFAPKIKTIHIVKCATSLFKHNNKIVRLYY